MLTRRALMTFAAFAFAGVGGGNAATPTVQTFTSSGTWTKPVGVATTTVQFKSIPGGGKKGGGRVVYIDRLPNGRYALIVDGRTVGTYATLAEAEAAKRKY